METEVIINEKRTCFNNSFDERKRVEGVRLVFDSDLDREYTDGNPDALHTSSTLFFPKSYNNTSFGFPKCLIKHYKIDVMDESGKWNTVIEVSDNHQRFVRHFLNVDTKAVRFIPISTYHSERKTEDYGSSTAHIFNFEVFDVLWNYKHKMLTTALDGDIMN